MSIGVVFWVIMLMLLVFGFWSNWPLNATNGRTFGIGFITWILLALLGWAMFGAAIHR